MIITKKILNKIIENSLKTNYNFLKKELWQFQIDVPKNIDTFEKYIVEINKFSKLEKGLMK